MMQVDAVESVKSFLSNRLYVAISIILIVGAIVLTLVFSLGDRLITALPGLQDATTDCQAQNPGFTQWCVLLTDPNTDIPGLINTNTTLLVVPDAAFNSIDPADAAFLETRPDLVNKIVKYHMLNGQYTETEIFADQQIATLQGESISFNATTDAQGNPESLVLNGNVNITDFPTAVDGIYLYPLDGFLIPDEVAALLPSAGGGGEGTLYEYIASQPQLSTLKDSLDATSVAEVNSTNAYTMLVPTNAAFAALPADVIAYLSDPAHVDDLGQVLRYHIIRQGRTAAELLQTGTLTSLYGANITVTGSPVVQGVPDITFTNDDSTITSKITTNFDVEVGTNSVVQWVDTVLVPKTILDKITPPVALKNLYDTIAADTKLTTLRSLIDQAGLKDALSATTEYTVFAPTNTAFEEADQDVLDKITSDPDLLEQTLKYHIVPGAYILKNLPDDPTTLQGERVDVERTLDANGSVLEMTLDGKSTGVSNIEATNGYVTRLQGVLIPDAVLDEITVPPVTNNTVTNNSTTNNTVRNNTVVNNSTTNTSTNTTNGGTPSIVPRSSSGTPQTGAGEVISIIIAVVLGLGGAVIYGLHVKHRRKAKA